MDPMPRDEPRATAEPPPVTARRRFVDGGHTHRVRALPFINKHSRASLRMVLQELADLAEFRVAALNRVREDGHLQMIESVGTGMTAAEMELSTVPVEIWAESVGRTARWGAWWFSAGEDCPPEVLEHSWVPDLPAAHAPGDWDPLTSLDCPVHDEDGNLVASLALDVPINGRVPSPEQHKLLDGLGRLASRSVLAILKGEHHAERARIAEAARAAVTSLGSDDGSVAESIRLASTALIDSLGVDRVETGWFDPAAIGLGNGATETGDLVVRHRELLLEAWRNDRVEQLPADTGAPGAPDVLLTPVGTDHQCYGALAVFRTTTRAAWTRAEVRGVREIATTLAWSIGRRLAQQQERLLLDELRATADESSMLAATVSHDLASPLNAMRNYLDLLEVPATPAAQQRIIDALRAGTAQLSDIADLLHRLDGDHPATRPSERVDMIATTSEVVRLHEPQAARDLVDLSFHTTVESAAVVVRRSDLVRIIANLTSNGLKYTRRGGAVRLRLTHEGEYVVLSCTDTGIGIAPDHLDRVFEDFYRAQDPQVLTLSGVGLGLPIVARLVKEHHGSVTITSELGVGTEVTIRMPSDGTPTAQ